MPWSIRFRFLCFWSHTQTRTHTSEHIWVVHTQHTFRWDISSTINNHRILVMRCPCKKEEMLRLTLVSATIWNLQIRKRNDKPMNWINLSKRNAKNRAVFWFGLVWFDSARFGLLFAVCKHYDELYGNSRSLSYDMWILE